MHTAATLLSCYAVDWKCHIYQQSDKDERIGHTSSTYLLLTTYCTSIVK